MEREDNRASKAKAWSRFVPNWYLLLLATSVIVLLVLCITLIVTIKEERIPRPAVPTAVECPGIYNALECIRSGCLWVLADVGPSCIMERDAFGYRVENVTEESGGPLLRLKAMTNDTPYGPSLENVVFKITYLTDSIVRFQFKDADYDRYEVPVQKDFPLLKEDPLGYTGNLSYEVVHSNETELFYFTVKRKDGTTLWDSRLGALLLSDQFLQIGSFLPTRNVYGLGEHSHDTLRHKMDFKSWTMFARDQPPSSPSNGESLYGVHPFYTCLELFGKSHGVFFLNSNAMEVVFTPAPAVTFRTIGGILDFFIFVGDNPEQVVQLYTSLIGRPMIPPYWSLGFQLSRYGYRRLYFLKAALDRNRELKIPQAVQYLDIDHMHPNKDFDFDDIGFGQLPGLINFTKEEWGLKWIIIQEPTIQASEDSEIYAELTNRSLFVRRSGSWKSDMFPEEDYMRDSNATLGKVWQSNYVAFLDFFQNDTKKWWKEKLVDHRETIDFDGLWIDMNEPANFGTNEREPSYCKQEILEPDECWVLRCPDDDYETPPYNPLKAKHIKKLSDKTICMRSVQGDSDDDYVHYNVHSLYGWSQSQPTLEAAQDATGTRSLVISRSTYPSSGRYVGHWLGDNNSTFVQMRQSIIGLLEFNMFGIPYVGADVCGFFGTAGPDLCKRWMQLGAFYPYYRNHNSLDSEPQDPAFFDDKEVAELSRKAIERRICFNPYLYTLLYKAHVNGSTVVRPLFHEYPNDDATWDMSTQFMWGKALMIVPILQENRTSVPVYFPNDEWWLFNETSSEKRPFSGRYVIEVEAHEYTPVYARGGSIIPYGNYDWNDYPESRNSTERNITLYVFPMDGEASGELFMDDGISKDTVENEAYGFYKFSYSNCTFDVTVKEYTDFNGTYAHLERVVIFEAYFTANVTGDYEVEKYEKCKCAIVNVGETMKVVKTFTLQDSDGKCPDSMP